MHLFEEEDIEVEKLKTEKQLNGLKIQYNDTKLFQMILFFELGQVEFSS